ncbi:hypothetical protein [Acinetobacter pittii]|uniref:hypothetical protein n=1 Tax=Acinetobacter pittii TaxID=48296 RepID=UPI0005EAD127|nr:hypothetical protein [Acinetobacter pittii]RZG98816.1 hypothetical protein EXE07_06290 [Acinetobacter pittii]RZH40977.1 hypothetical protein EXD93_05375 [Acinetobacter pittii]
MNEIKHPLKEQFLLLLENDIFLIWFKPKDLWAYFEGAPDSSKWQIYSFIKQLVKFGYLKKVYDQLGNQYYSETDKLSDFRISHCKEKAKTTLTEKLRLLDQEKAEKNFEIQITKELSKQLPEINYCLKNYIKDKNDILVKIENKKNVINNIIKNIESLIY